MQLFETAMCIHFEKDQVSYTKQILIYGPSLNHNTAADIFSTYRIGKSSLDTVLYNANEQLQKGLNNQGHSNHTVNITLATGVFESKCQKANVRNA